ncbi:MAG: hypothetical protein ACYC6Y_12525 [Thermoguttaceae bacterium]
MGKLVARSLAAALVVVLISGCSSTGGKKSFSWSSMNPMTYFAKSDSAPVPKPSEQLAPTVTLPSAADVSSTKDASGSLAPPSPYGQKGRTDSSYSSVASRTSSTNTAPQRGMYDLNGYSGSSLPLSQSSKDYSQYTPPSTTGSGYAPSAVANADSPATSSGYQMPPSNGYGSGSSAQYSLGGGPYDIQPGPTQTAASLPAYSSPAQTAASLPAYNSPTQTAASLPAYNNAVNPYASSTSPPSGSLNSTSPYQMPPMPSQASGYSTGLAQDPYKPMSSSSSAINPYPASGGTPEPYSGYASGYQADSGSVGNVAALPTLPPLSNGYSTPRPAYEPGNTGYNPPNVPSYTTPPTGGYVQPATATQPNYSPGSVSRYSGTGDSTAPTGYGTTGAMY